ncbi:hypothetical protein B0G80_8670 [Paraburkholderia sp. BL6669N2]|nr:hypothetical protein B0G80_8670 [Paraburkholderia sp. BL6669N2]
MIATRRTRCKLTCSPSWPPLDRAASAPRICRRPMQSIHVAWRLPYIFMTKTGMFRLSGSQLQTPVRFDVSTQSTNCLSLRLPAIAGRLRANRWVIFVRALFSRDQFARIASAGSSLDGWPLTVCLNGRSGPRAAGHNLARFKLRMFAARLHETNASPKRYAPTCRWQTRLGLGQLQCPVAENSERSAPRYRSSLPVFPAY